MLVPLLFTVALAAGPKPALIPSSTRVPIIDGDVSDVSPGLDRKAPATPNLTLTSRVSNKKGVLYLTAKVGDKAVTETSEVSFTVFFPDAGTTATGYIFRVGPKGLLQSTAGDESALVTPAFAFRLAKAAVRKQVTGFDVELALPAKALPRFPATGALGLSVCAEYRHSSTGPLISTCGGENPGGEVALLPQDFRSSLRLKVEKDVVGLEGREGGWVGYAPLHYVSFALGDEALTPVSLSALVDPTQAVKPQDARLPIPQGLVAPDKRALFIVLTGADPFQGEECLGRKEVRMAWYAVKDRTAVNVLEWPASSCTLGKAMRFDLSPDGNLAIGYTQGATSHFTWSGDHFERSELGKAVETW